jgi:acyl carrier protein
MTNTHWLTDEPALVRRRVDEVVLQLVDAYAPDSAAPARPDDTLLDDLAFSSLRVVELAFAIEDLFAMDSAVMAEAPPVGTVTDVSAFVFDRVAAGEAFLPDQASVDALVAEL